MKTYCKEETQIIKTVIKLQNGMVMVFDADGEQIPDYQGQVSEVAAIIQRDATPEAVFEHWFGYTAEPQVVDMEGWQS